MLLFSLQLMPVFCQDCYIDAPTQKPYAINEAKIYSKPGFIKPVYMFAELLNGDSVLVFKTEKLGYTKEITAEYYSQGNILALSLYHEPEKKVLLARQDMELPPPVQGAYGIFAKSPEVQSPAVRLFFSAFKPARYLPFAILAAAALSAALLRLKKKTPKKNFLAPVILLAAALATTAVILLYTEKPEIAEIRESSSLTPAGYSHFAIKSAGTLRFPLHSIPGYPDILLDHVPVIVFSAGMEYFLEENTKIEAWAKHE